MNSLFRLAALLLFLSCVSLAIAQTQQAGTSSPQTPSSNDKKPEELSDWYDLVLGAQGGGGLDATSTRTPTAFAGVKVGFPILYIHNQKTDFARTLTLDLQYDRLQSQNGFSTEFSALLPVFRIPGPQLNPNKNYFRFYAEPGLGYRAGDGPFGGYSSAKIMIAFLSDKRLTASSSWGVPYVEIQRRFPFSDPLHGNTRAAFGLAFMLCKHCGID